MSSMEHFCVCIWLSNMSVILKTPTIPRIIEDKEKPALMRDGRNEREILERSNFRDWIIQKNEKFSNAYHKKQQRK
jgi:hypothetical protein